MSEEKLLKQYVREVVSEGFFKIEPDRDDDKKKKKSLWNKIRSFFTGESSSSSKIAEEWLEDQQMNFDFDLPESFTTSVIAFVKKKYPLAKNRSRGDSERADSLMRRALDSRFRQTLREYQKMNEKLDDDEEDI